MCISISIGHDDTDDAFDFLFISEKVEQNRHVVAAAAVSVDGFAPLRAWRILFDLQIWKSHVLQDALKLQRGETLIDLILSNLQRKLVAQIETDFFSYPQQLLSSGS